MWGGRVCNFQRFCLQILKIVTLPTLKKDRDGDLKRGKILNQGKIMTNLKKQIAAYETMKEDLEIEHFGKWVVFYDEKLIGTCESFNDAATVAVDKFDRGPYLIRQVGRPPLTLPASVLNRPVYESH